MNVRELALHANGEALRLCEILLPAGKKVGNQWMIGDVTGNPGDSMAVMLDGPKQGQWYDHAAAAGGDMLKLVQLNRNLSGSIAAADETRKLLGLPEWKPSLNGKPKADLYDPCSKGWMVKAINQWVNPVRSWAYHDEHGNVIAHVCRLEWKEGDKTKKDVIPQRKNEKGEWAWKGWKGDEKRPLYDAHVLAKTNDGRNLLIVEGEKTAEAAKKLLPKCTVTTWPGGTSQISRADWSIIPTWKGKVVFWPDADNPGATAAIYLKGRFPEVRIVKLPSGLPKGWDLADEVPAGVSVAGVFDSALDDTPPPVLEDAPKIGPDEKPYIPLGIDETGYFFLNRREGFVLHYTASMFTEIGIQRIATDEYWEGQGYHKAGSTKLDYQRIAKTLISECVRIGAYQATLTRGRGVFIDDGRVVIHLGDRLYVDGVEMEPTAIKSRYVYPRRPAIRSVDLTNPLKAHESAELLFLLEKCTWQNNRSAYLLGGFIVCMALAGALPWRPHLFLIGAASSGKSWVTGHIVYPILSELAHTLMAVASSEAGLRQLMGIDALGFILDEFDAEHVRTADALSEQICLARQSSSDSGGAGVKGTQQGIARTYALKSCFMFVGTAPAIAMKADQSRITTVELCKPDAESNAFNFAEIQKIAASTTENREWVERFVGRLFLNVNAILASITVFRRVASRILGDTRAGDQYGTLLGGAWMLFQEKPPTDKEAEDFMATMTWEDVIPTDHDTDHSKAVRAFMGFRMDYEENGHLAKETVGRLIERANDSDFAPESRAVAKRALAQMGVRIELTEVYIARGHRGVENIFRGTPYVQKWEHHFLRLNGARQEIARISGTSHRCIVVPTASILV